MSTMDNIKSLIELNIQLEGLLRVIAERDSAEARDLLRQAYVDYCEQFDVLLDRFNVEALSGMSVDVAVLESSVEAELEPVSEPVVRAAAEENEEDVVDEIIPVELGALPFTGKAPVEETQWPEDTEETEAPVDSEETEAPADSEDGEETEAPSDESDTSDTSDDSDDSDTSDNSDNVDSTATAAMRVDDMLTRRTATDLRRVFTLNDKLRFRRSLFDKNDEEYGRILDLLAEIDTFEAAKECLAKELGRDVNGDDVEINDFLSIIKPHYNA